MNTTRTRLLPLSQAATFLRVPSDWLKAEAEAGRLPSLQAGNRLLFAVETVGEILLRRASEQTEAAK